MGYPNSTGMAGAVAYRVTDERCDPTDTKQTFAERSVRLPGCFLCYTPHPEAPPVARAPCLAAGYVTFGCFNALAGDPGGTRAVGPLLRAVPRGWWSGEAVRLRERPAAVLSAMAEQGVASWRVDVRALAEKHREHLGAYGAVDVALDTFPYAGTTTTCEALWRGVPVVTMRGGAHAHNVGVSLLGRRPRARVRRRGPRRVAPRCARARADRAALAAAAGCAPRCARPGVCATARRTRGSWRRRTSRCGGGTARRARVR